MTALLPPDVVVDIVTCVGRLGEIARPKPTTTIDPV
jgi:hypothetical protein